MACVYYKMQFVYETPWGWWTAESTLKAHPNIERLDWKFIVGHSKMYFIRTMS